MIAPRQAEGARVLVADDIPENRDLIRDLLESEGWLVDEAQDGLDALERVATADPDVVLLDLQMPRMDGFEACRRLKSNSATAAIPVLLVTALNEREHRLAGIGAGANDFINKPIDGTDLVLRVRNALTMRSLYTELDQKYTELQRLERLRDDLVHMLVHDLRSPLSALSLTLQIVAEDMDDDDGFRGDVLEAARCTADVTEMVSDVLDASRMEAGEMPLARTIVDIGDVCAEVVERLRPTDRERVSLESTDASDHACLADHKILGRVVANLLDNALKYHWGSDPIRIGIAETGQDVRVYVEDRGPGVPKELQDTIFEKYGQASSTPGARRSTGLGLAFCRLAIDAHGGRIGVADREGGGSCFWFEVASRVPGEQDVEL